MSAPVTMSQGVYNSYSTTPENAEPPKKYVKIDGVTQLNPKYVEYQEKQGKKATTALNPQMALPVISNMQQHEELHKMSKNTGQGDVPLAPTMDKTIEMMQELDICNKVGVSADAMVDGLGKVFSKYEIPMGMMNKLMSLTEYDKMEFMVDDSGSMNDKSNVRDNQGRPQTRWQEAHSRLKKTLDLLSYVPTPIMVICFLNRKTTITLQRKGETPEHFLENAYRQIDAAFAVEPTGSTPIKACLNQSLQQGQGKKVARYLYCDGLPDGGKAAIESINKMVVVERTNREENPYTFNSCSDNDQQVGWMKDLEEVAEYCAEYDDFEDEAKEVLRDQGDALPFTEGFYLVAGIVGAMNPDDLDAMDESVPFTKWTLDNLLGIQTTEQEYRHYFNRFKEAQRIRKIEGKTDSLKSNQNWEPHFHEFRNERMSKNIQAVQSFKNQLKQLVESTN